MPGGDVSHELRQLHVVHDFETERGPAHVPQERGHVRPQDRRRVARGPHRLAVRRRELCDNYALHRSADSVGHLEWRNAVVSVLRPVRQRARPERGRPDGGRVLASRDRTRVRQGALQEEQPAPVVHERSRAEEQSMRFVVRRLDERGNMVIAMMVLMVATGLIAASTALVYRGLKTSRRSGDSANALQLADAAVNDAVKEIGSAVGTSLPLTTKTLGT